MASTPAKLRNVIVRQFSATREPRRFSVGDIIRCEHFRWGLRFASADEITVGWTDVSYPEYHAKNGNGELAHDETRAMAPFLISSVKFVDGEGPADLYPGNHRLSLKIQCWRLTDDFALVPVPETITFDQHEPMSVAQPPESNIELLGCAELPISWDER